MPRLRKGLASRTLVSAALALFLCSCAGVPSPRPPVPGEDPVSKAQAYLIARGFELSPQAALVLDYPRRRFGLAWADPVVAEARRRAGDPRFEGEYGIFRRMIDPSGAELLRSSITETIERYKVIPTTRALLTSIYCDWISLDPAYLSFLADEKPGLRLWHVSALLALGYLEANGCLRPADHLALKDTLARSAKAFIEAGMRPGESSRAEVASTIGAFYLGVGRERADGTWVDFLRETQDVDGSWASEGDSIDDRDFAAVWGLFALLESEGGSALAVPLIPPGD
jgi:hypothetical protein